MEETVADLLLCTKDRSRVATSEATGVNCATRCQAVDVDQEVNQHLLGLLLKPFRLRQRQLLLVMVNWKLLAVRMPLALSP